MTTKIDWSLVAAPREDGYDTAVILEQCASGRYGSQVIPPPKGELVWGLGRARWVGEVEPHQLPGSDYIILPTDDEIVQRGLALIKLWPAVQIQCAEILLALCPMATKPRRFGAHGCSCGQFGDDFGWIYVTADDPWGFIEGIVHEMGHWKLRALGIWFEDWTDLILENSPSELYPSPVRKDMPRPMGAVLHAQYSYIHVAAMCVAMLKATEDPNRGDYEWTALQLTRITEGQRTLRAYAVGTPEVGAPFLRGLDEWTTRVLEEGAVAIAKGGLTA